MAREDWATASAAAARGKQRRIFSQQFKLQVLDSYRRDSDCRGNQRATARKYGIHRRQIQKWLQVEASLRGSLTPPSPPSKVTSSPPALEYTSRDRLYSLEVKVFECYDKSSSEDRLSSSDDEPIIVDDTDECLDLSTKKDYDYEEKTLYDLDRPQETALCLVTRGPSPPPPAAPPAPLWPPPPPLCCTPESCPYPPAPADFTCWSYQPYLYHTSYVTKWLHHDAPYYKQAVKDISHHTPLYC